MNLLRPLLFSFSFLWRISLPGPHHYTLEEIKRAIVFFPLVGFFEGFLMFLPATLFLKTNFFLSPLLLSLFLLIILLFLRGIFHLDGLADTFDALAIKELNSKEETLAKRLAVMKDPGMGVAGGVAVFLCLLIKLLFMEELISAYSISAYLFFLYAFTLSRSFLPLIMAFSKPAKEEGLGYFLIRHATLSSSLKALFLGLALLFLITFFLDQSIIPLILTCVFLGVALFWGKHFFTQKFGGLTGDNLGALVEIAEILGLTLGVFFYG